MGNIYYTVEQVAELLSLHQKTVQRYIREGKLRASKIGKGWRIAGHDLSLFAEQTQRDTISPEKNDGYCDVTVSAVADIIVADKDAAIRVMNTLTAALNSKPPEFGRSSLHTQYIDTESKVRVTLWGGARFIAVIMDSIAVLSDNDETEY